MTDGIEKLLMRIDRLRRALKKIRSTGPIFIAVDALAHDDRLEKKHEDEWHRKTVRRTRGSTRGSTKRKERRK